MRLHHAASLLCGGGAAFSSLVEGKRISSHVPSAGGDAAQNIQSRGGRWNQRQQLKRQVRERRLRSVNQGLVVATRVKSCVPTDNDRLLAAAIYDVPALEVKVGEEDLDHEDVGILSYKGDRKDIINGCPDHYICIPTNADPMSEETGGECVPVAASDESRFLQDRDFCECMEGGYAVEEEQCFDTAVAGCKLTGAYVDSPPTECGGPYIGKSS